MRAWTLTELTIMDVTGGDAPRVVNNLCTAPLLQLTEGLGHEAFFTEVRGRTLGHACIYRHGTGVRLIGAPGQAEAIAAHIDRYTITEAAEVADLSGQWAGLLLDAAAVDGYLTAGELSHSPDAAQLAWCPLPRALQSPNRPSDDALQLAAAYQVPWLGIPAVLLAGPRDQIEPLGESLVSGGVTLEPLATFHAARIAARFPWFGIDMDERHLPQEADRDAAAISLTKGCYLGQETVARLDALGQVQKKLVRWRIDSPEPPPAGAELHDGQRLVGRLTSVAEPMDQAAPQGHLALGFARRSHFDPGRRATWRDAAGAAYEAEVV